MLRVYGIILLFLTLISFSYGEEKKRAFSVFNIVKFANDACEGSDSKNGTCYTEDECEDKGGKASGTCAEGYGICCVFTLGCGDTAAENCTYFESNGVTSGACNVKINKCASTICQIRLDLTTFEIAGPSTLTTVNANILGGVISQAAAGKDASTKGSCLDDTFSISVPGGKSTGVICGKNSGEHLYIEAVDEGATLSFQLSDTATATRKWNIKILQYSCSYENLAPAGCLQYFYGMGATGSVSSFNYEGGIHLANQDQKVCVRRESGKCSICWSHATGDFDISYAAAADMGHNAKSDKCCGYGMDGMGTLGYDCLIIPNAMNSKVTKFAAGGSEFCGRALADGLDTAGAAKTTEDAAATVCSKVTPFGVRFLSDGYEFSAMEDATDAKGFKLIYNQVDC